MSGQPEDPDALRRELIKIEWILDRAVAEALGEPAGSVYLADERAGRFNHSRIRIDTYGNAFIVLTGNVFAKDGIVKRIDLHPPIGTTPEGSSIVELRRLFGNWYYFQPTTLLPTTTATDPGPVER